MTVFAPAIFVRLLDLHGVDRMALAADLADARQAAVRTRDWMDSSQSPRSVLKTVPTGFPRFKATLVDDTLLIDGMRLGDATLRTTRRTSRLTIPAKGIPKAIAAALPGRRLAELIGDEAVDPATRIVAVRTISDKGVESLRIDLRLVHAQIDAPAELPSSRAVATRPVDVVDLVERSGRVALASPRLDADKACDRAHWPLAVAAAHCVAIRPSRSVNPPADAMDLVFEYHREMVSIVGQSGLGGRFERGPDVWRFDATDAAVAGMPALLADLPVPVITPDGTIWTHHGNDGEAA